jgi:outer membrane protein with beta-barrel domain
MSTDRSSSAAMRLPLALIPLAAMWLWPGRGVALLTAQTTCVPTGIGVPPNFQPPNWWNSGGPEYRTTLDDRTWQGAVSHSDGTINSGHVDFRAVQRPDSLFLSWVVKVDPQPDADPTDDQAADALWFGIEQSGGEPPIVFRVSLATTNPGEALGTNAIKAWKASAGTSPMTLPTLVFATGTASPPPAWASGTTRRWVQSPAGESWAFQTVIPTNGTDPLNLSNGLKVGAEFKVWYQLTVKLHDAPCSGSSPCTAYYTWPRNLVTMSPNRIITFDGVNGPGLSQWAPFTTLPAPTTGSCLGDVTIASHSDIGTTNGDPSLIAYSLPIKPLATTLPSNLATMLPQNTFFVRATNRTATQIMNGQVIARFWVANWGSQPNAWESVPNPSANLWKEVPPPPPSTPPAPSNTLPVLPGVNAIQLTWTMSVCQWFNFLPRTASNPFNAYPDGELIAWMASHPSITCPNDGTTLTERYAANPHQCVLVELVSPPGSSPRTYLRKSYWNNLRAATASRFVDSAAISVQGLDVSEGSGPKTVFLYVQRFNMPRRITHKPAPRDTSSQKERGRAAGQPNDSVAKVFDPVFGDLKNDVASPTYWVHVYRETADKVVVQGVPQPVLRPQSSFGYRVRHDGDLEGWKHSLKGAQLVQLAPNFYKLTVPNDSFAIVTTTIEALTPKPFALSLHGGVSLPHGDLNGAFDPGVSITGDLEHRLNNTFSVAALLGYDRFENQATTGHLDVYQISGSGRAFLSTSGAVAPFVEAGAGVYDFSPGSTDPGTHFGAGVEVEASREIVLGVSYRAHIVFTSGSSTTFSSVQAGGRIRF